MPSRLRAIEWRAALAAAALAFAGCAFAGAQQYEVLSARVRACRGPSSRRSRGRSPDEESARQFLALVRYESMRAGLDPHLILAVIDVESHFRKYAVSKSGARGLMQVMPFWIEQIGGKGDNLFQERTNLRYGCVILRHYLDRERGNLSNALARYNGSLGQPQYPTRVLRAWKERWALGVPA
jgi:soluble lytic murein transglycosylase-like protein